MDRRTLLERLDAVRAGSDDLDLPEFDGLDRLLAEDAALREEFLRRQSLDRVLTAAMHDVPVPPGAKSRILIRLAGANSTKVAAGDRGHSRHRALAVLLSLAMSLLVAVALWTMRSPASEPLELSQVRDAATILLRDPASGVPFEGRFDPQLPSGAWRRLKIEGGPLGLLPENDAHRAAAWSFSFDSRRPVRGVLVAVPVSEFASPPAADREYVGGNAVTWTEGGFVYVCQVEGSIDNLLRQLDEVRLA